MSSPRKSVVDRILRFNGGREPERLALKYTAMRKNACTFLRGTCHLFYEYLPKSRLLHDAPLVWACGDLHLENFGSYQGDNRLVYFDLNDFEEGLLAPCTWDLLRLLTSVLVGHKTLHVTSRQALAFAERLLESYVAAIQVGKARWVERETAEGLVKELLNRLQHRERKAFLDRHTVRDGNRRKIRSDPKHALEATFAQKRSVKAFMARFAREQPDPKFFRFLDAARRVAGTGSLGVDRYVVLVEGTGSPDGNYFLDLKQAFPSSPARRLKLKQPGWETQGQRIVTIQSRVQAVSMAFLRPVVFNGSSYVLRGLQPVEDRVALDTGKGELGQLENLMTSLGNLVAWGELRSSGQSGSTTPDELASFWRKRSRSKKLIALARQCAAKTQVHWQQYSQAYDSGIFDQAGRGAEPDNRE